MAGEIIRQGDPTSHGGKVLEGSLTDICHGKPVAYVGHKVQCPKCKGIFPIAEGVLTTTFYGKGVAVAGMKTSCGATLIATQFTDIVEYGAGAEQIPAPLQSRAHAVDAIRPPFQTPSPDNFDTGDNPPKSIRRLFWTYGPAEIPLDGVSRHYVDLNLHIETENYRPGEVAHIVIENDDGTELLSGIKVLRLKAIVDPNGKAKLMDVLRNKTVEIGRIG